METIKEMKALPKFNKDELINNPFVKPLLIDVTEITSSDTFELSEEGTFVNKIFYQEKVQKIELYYTKGVGDLVAKLSDKAQRLLFHIFYTLDRGKDYTQLNQEHFSRRNNVKSDSTYYNAIKELTMHGFITRTQFPTVYWINPEYFFPGSRVRKFPDNLDIGQSRIM